MRDGALAKTHPVLSLVTKETLLVNVVHCTVVGISSIRTVIATAICCATHAPFANVSKATLTDDKATPEISTAALRDALPV